MRSTPGSHPPRAHANVFERHAKKLRALLVPVPFLAIDCAASRLLGSRGVDEFRSRHPYYHHGLIAARESVSVWGTGAPYPVFTNSPGMFDRAARQVPLQSDRHRIVFIGDSYTEGLGVPFEETFVGRISERIDRDKVEILNAGVMSYSPKLYFLRTRHLIEQLGLDLDELYVFIDISDIQDEILYGGFVPTQGEPRPGLRERAHRLLKKHSFSYWSIDRLLRLREVERRMERYSAQVRLWRSFAEKHDSGFIDLFPTLITELPYPEFEARYVLPGDAHWSPEGHALVADAVWPTIEKGLREAGAFAGAGRRSGP